MVVLSGLVGAGIGAVLTGLVAWLVSGRQIAAQDRARHLADLRGVIADLWGATDSLWRAKRDLSEIVFDMTSTPGGHRDSQLQEKRLAAFAQIRTASASASSALGLLRILSPDLSVSAQALFDASSRTINYRSELDDRARLDSDRAAALAAFEEAARDLLRT